MAALLILPGSLCGMLPPLMGWTALLPAFAAINLSMLLFLGAGICGVCFG